MKIRELLSDESKWTQGLNARDKNGYYAELRGEDAARWCLNGAAIRLYYDSDPEVYRAIGRKIGCSLNIDPDINNDYWRKIVHWNDLHSRTFAEVKELVERLDI